MADFKLKLAGLIHSPGAPPPKRSPQKDKPEPHTATPRSPPLARPPTRELDGSRGSSTTDAGSPEQQPTSAAATGAPAAFPPLRSVPGLAFRLPPRGGTPTRRLPHHEPTHELRGESNDDDPSPGPPRARSQTTAGLMDLDFLALPQAAGLSSEGQRQRIQLGRDRAATNKKRRKPTRANIRERSKTAPSSAAATTSVKPHQLTVRSKTGKPGVSSGALGAGDIAKATAAAGGGTDTRTAAGGGTPPRGKKKGKRGNKGISRLEIGSPTSFEHVGHLGVDGISIGGAHAIAGVRGRALEGTGAPPENAAAADEEDTPLFKARRAASLNRTRQLDRTVMVSEPENDASEGQDQASRPQLSVKLGRSSGENFPVETEVDEVAVAELPDAAAATVSAAPTTGADALTAPVAAVATPEKTTATAEQTASQPATSDPKLESRVPPLRVPAAPKMANSAAHVLSSSHDGDHNAGYLKLAFSKKADSPVTPIGAGLAEETLMTTAVLLAPASGNEASADQMRPRTLSRVQLLKQELARQGAVSTADASGPPSARAAAMSSSQAPALAPATPEPAAASTGPEGNVAAAKAMSHAVKRQVDDNKTGYLKLNFNKKPVAATAAGSAVDVEAPAAAASPKNEEMRPRALSKVQQLKLELERASNDLGGPSKVERGSPRPGRHLNSVVPSKDPAPVVYTDVSGSFANSSSAIQNSLAGYESVIYAEVRSAHQQGGAQSETEPALPAGQVGRAPMPLPSTGPTMSPPSTGRPPMPVPTNVGGPAVVQQPVPYTSTDGSAATTATTVAAAAAGGLEEPAVANAAALDTSPKPTGGSAVDPAPRPAVSAASAECVTISLDADVLYVEQLKWDGVDAPTHGFRIVNTSGVNTYSVLISIAKSKNMGWLIGDESVTTTMKPGATVDLDEVIVISPDLGWALAAEFEWNLVKPDPAASHRSILKTTSEGANSLETELANREVLEAAAEKSVVKATSGTFEDMGGKEVSKRKPTAPRQKSAARSIKEAAAKGKVRAQETQAMEAGVGLPVIPLHSDAFDSEAYDIDGLPLPSPRNSSVDMTPLSPSPADAAKEDPSLLLPRNISLPRGKEKGKRSMKDIKAQCKAAKKGSARLDTDEEDDDRFHAEDPAFRLPSTRKKNPLFVDQPRRSSSESDW